MYFSLAYLECIDFRVYAFWIAAFSDLDGEFLILAERLTDFNDGVRPLSEDLGILHGIVLQELLLLVEDGVLCGALRLLVDGLLRLDLLQLLALGLGE